jgi:hypothetical protein
MAKKQQGISQREYAKLAGVRPSYVQRLVATGKLPVLPDGSLDSVACDAARAKFTRVGRGQRRWQRRHPESAERTIAPQAEKSIRMCNLCGQPHWFWTHANCSVCNEDYVLYSAPRIDHSPDPQRFCSAKCAGTAPPPPKKIICQQCADPAGYFADEARQRDSGAPQRFCDMDCENDAAMGKTRVETQYRLWVHAILEYGDTPKDLKERGWGDWGGGRPWPRKRRTARKS